MNPNATAATNRLCNPTSSDKFLAPFPPGPTSQPETAASAYELTEADVFWSTPYQNTSSSSSSPPDPRRNVAGRPHASGILAALPPTKPDPTRPVFFNHKASASSSSSSRMIPKKAQHQHVDGHQSAPVNVPAMTEAMRRRRRKGIQFDDDDDRDGGDGEMLLPPHEVVATRRRVACSVLEGVGRTLKGRDLRQVRNAVWRKTGFLD